MGRSTSTRSRCSSARPPTRTRRTSICWCASGICGRSTRTRSRTTTSCRCPWALPLVRRRRAATASRADAADKQPQTAGDRLRQRLAITRRTRRKAWVDVGPRRRSERRAPAPSEASAASPARARTNLFASTTAVLTTTSGRSSTFSSNRRPARVRPLGELVPAAAAPRLPARVVSAVSAGEVVHPIVADQQDPGVKTDPGPAALAPSQADSLEERRLSSR